MGVVVNNISEAADAAKRLKERRQGRLIEPVLIAWDGKLNFLPVKITPTDASINAELTLEGGNQVRHYAWDNIVQFTHNPDQPASLQEIRLPFPELLPCGYHHLHLNVNEGEFACLVISAPVHAFTFAENQKYWGVFSPLYALRSESNWGIGDVGDLRCLNRFCADLAIDVIALLPLLPIFLKEHFNPSPYSPVSRSFWNEIYIEPAKIPELAECPEAAALFKSDDFQQKLNELRYHETVDYRQVAEIKRSLLEILAEDFFRRRPEPRWGQYQTYLFENHDVELYTRFRSISEERGAAWRDWPVSQRSGQIAESDCRPELLRYYRYSQFIIQTQLSDVISEIRRSDQSLYLDMPLGVHPDGYDAWREQGGLIQGVSVGAPPDSAFPGGQDWGFQPPHPEQQRENGYRSFIDAIRHQLKFAGILRLDHIMGLHRLFCIPTGKSPSEGVYIKYNAEEMYAILCLESQRHHAIIVGEDLGLVPPEVRPMMNRHQIYRSYITQYEMTGNTENPIPAPPHFSVAALNTHDLHPFAAFWSGEDIPERLKLGVINPERAGTETELRRNSKNELGKYLDADGSKVSVGEFGRSITEILAQSQVQLLLINVADLWDECRAQNIPGTVEQRPNWRIKNTLSLEKLKLDLSINNFLKRINRIRKTD
ncbi:MAG: 4-alpha-glucanotransferase [Dehalogenimonas sp.]